MISYDYYRIFYYVCKYKNFTKAANVLLTSQSSISHTMQSLEHQLGCRLFVRNNRGIELTPEGLRLYDYIADGCEQFMKGERELLNFSDINCGTVYLGTTETAMHCYLFDALDRFHLKYPDVKFQIHNLNSSEAVNALRNGLVDLAVTASPIETGTHMRTTNLMTINDILIAGSSYKELDGYTISLKELSSYPVISFSKGTWSRGFMDNIFKDNGLLFSPSIESATSDLILPMVKHNLGLGFIPYPMASDAIHNREVFRIFIKEEIPSRHICMITDRHHPRSMVSEKFQSFLLEYSGNI